MAAAVLAGLIALGGCVEPVDPGAGTTGTALEALGRSEFGFTFDEAFSLVTCTEIIDGSWTGRVRLYFGTDASDGSHVQLHVDIHGTAVGETTGDTYQLDLTMDQVENAPGPPPYELTFVQPLVFAGRQSVLRQYLQEHVTVDADGEVTATRTVMAQDCSP